MGTLVGSTLRDVLCTQFNGSTQYGFVDDPSWKADTQGAFYLWYRPTTVLSANGFKSFLSYGVQSGGNNSQLSFIQRWNPSVTINATYRSQPIPDINGRATNNGPTFRAYGDHIFAAGAWVLLGIESNGSAWQWTVNGVAIPSTYWTTEGQSNNGLWMGGISGGNHRLVVGAQFVANSVQMFDDNRTNELIYFRRPLTAGERTALYNGGVTRNPREVVAESDIGSWWQMGDADDTNALILDRVGSNNLTLVATPSIVAFP
jgi:hypothetical protein